MDWKPLLDAATTWQGAHLTATSVDARVAQARARFRAHVEALGRLERAASTATPAVATFVDVLAAAVGPGDVAAAWRAWREGRPSPGALDVGELDRLERGVEEAQRQVSRVAVWMDSLAREEAAIRAEMEALRRCVADAAADHAAATALGRELARALDTIALARARALPAPGALLDADAAVLEGLAQARAADARGFEHAAARLSAVLGFGGEALALCGRLRASLERVHAEGTTVLHDLDLDLGQLAAEARAATSGGASPPGWTPSAGPSGGSTCRPGRAPTCFSIGSTGWPRRPISSRRPTRRGPPRSPRSPRSSRVAVGEPGRPPLVLAHAVAERWAALLGRALDALRLNRQFPPWERVRDHLAAAAASAPTGLRVDRASALPVAREWMRVRVEAELRTEGGRPDTGGPPPTDGGPNDRGVHPPDRSLLPAREVHVALRNVDGDRASYAVRVDRLDIATATVSRYSLVVADRPGRVVSVGELALRAAERFRRKLELLSTQDAALAFAVLRDQEGLDVEEVVRGVVGPGALAPGDPLLPHGDPGCGPAVLRALALRGPLLSACLERASIDLSEGRVDDPLATSVVLPGASQRFGLARSRKWAAVEADVPLVRAWLGSLGSRGLVYGYRGEA